MNHDFEVLSNLLLFQSSVNYQHKFTQQHNGTTNTSTEKLKHWAGIGTFQDFLNNAQ